MLPTSNRQLPSTTPVDRTSDFLAPWCKAVFEDPQWRLVPFGYLSSSKQPQKVNNFWADTLSSSRTLRAVRGFVRKDKRHGNDSPDAMMLLSLGEGLAGAPNRLHGGFTATALDMILGFAINATKENPVPISTATLTVDYKAPISLPSVILAKAWLVREEGRKHWVRGAIENSAGKVLATGTALYIVLRAEKI